MGDRASVQLIQKCRKENKPKLSFRYQLSAEEDFLNGLLRQKSLVEAAQRRMLEQKQIEQIKVGLNKERHSASNEKQAQQLMERSGRLRLLKSYLGCAINAKDRMTQLKMEDAEIERRWEHAKMQAQEIRAKYHAAEQRQKEQELKTRQESKKLCAILKAQMAEYEEKCREEREERIRERNELMESLRLLEEQDRKDAQAAHIKKIQLRNEMIEDLRQRSELRKMENKPNKNDLTYIYQVEKERAAIQQNLDNARNEKLKRQEELAAKLGEDLLKINTAKQQAVDSFIDYWVNYQQNQNDLLYEQEQQKEQEIRRDLQRMMIMQENQRTEEKQRKINSAMDLGQKRLAQSHDDSEKILLQKRMERERAENEKFLKMLAAEREERKARDHALALTYDAKDEAKKLDNDIETVRINILNEQPISLLRYLPSKLVSSDYLPQPLREMVREEVLRDPIPMFNKKRHQPHMKRVKAEGDDMIKCCKSCPPTKPISNIF